VKQSRVPTTVYILGLASLFTDISSEMIHAVLPLFLVQGLGSSAIMVGWIEGAAETIASLLKVMSGGISDRIARRKPLVVAGYGLSAVVKPLFALATSPFLVFAARCLDRVGKGIRGAPRDALIADTTPRELHGAAYGLRQSLDSVGAVLGPTIAFLIMFQSNNNFRQVFLLAIIPAVIPVVLLLFGIHEKKSERTRTPVNPFTVKSMKELGSGFWIIFLATLVFSLGNSSDAFIILKAAASGMPIALIPLAFTMMNLVYASLAYPMGKISDRVGRKTLLASSFVFYALAYAGLALADSQPAIWLLLLAYGVYLASSQGVLMALTADRVPPQLRGTAFGLINLATAVAMLPASLFAGWLFDCVSRQAPFYAGSAFALLALLVLAFDREPHSTAGKEVDPY
jgi:MFS family permease